MSFYVNAVTQGNNILLREIRDDGTEFRDKIPFEPTLYIESSTESGFSDIHGLNLKPKSFANIWEAKEFIKKYKDTGLDVFGMERWHTQYLVEEFHGMEYDMSKLKIRYIDIEVDADEFPTPEVARWPINAISYFDMDTKKFYTFALTNDNGDRWVDANSEYKTVYNQYDTEKELLIDFLSHWKANYPHIISGWNSAGFDVPYIINRIENLLGETAAKSLSPWNKIKTWTGKDNFYNDITTYEIVGVSHIDYMDAYKKHTFANQEFYSLDHIAWVELGERKLDYSEHGSLYNLYRGDFQKFVDYNIRDVDLIVRLDQKLSIMSIIVDIAYKAKINFEETFSPVKTWDSIIYEHLFKENNTIVPLKSISKKSGGYAGGYVKEPIRGVYDWVASFDLASLYPSIIRQWNIGPETLRDVSNYDPNGGYVPVVLDESFVHNSTSESFALNGCTFDNSKQSFLAELMENLYNERKQAKGKMIEAAKAGDDAGRALYKTRQMVLKVLLNSLYGALGNQYFRFYDVRLATAITLTGQLVIQWAAKSVDEYINNLISTDNEEYVVYTDTDSIYVDMGKFVNTIAPNKSTEDTVNFLDKACSAIEDLCIKPSYNHLQNYLACRENTMIMDREVIGSGIFVQKKRYAIAMHDNEGERFEKQKLKVMGLEVAKKDCPEICRNALSHCLRILLIERDNDILLDYIDEFTKQYYNTDIINISQVKSVSNVTKYEDGNGWYIKGTPANSKAAINFNRYCATKQHEKIKNGDKIRLLELKKPNPVQDSIIGFIDNVPVGIDKYVNKDLMFNKHFLKPLGTIVHTIGWSTERKGDLSDFF